MSGWIDIEPDDITQFVDELRVVGELERLHAVRLEAVNASDALEGTGADAYRFRHQGGRPVGGLAERVGPGERGAAELAAIGTAV
jgi:hypothetical protein